MSSEGAKNTEPFSREGIVFDLVKQRQFPGRVTVKDGVIAAVEECATKSQELLLPGMVNAHVHIESSMLPPSEYARLDVCNGSVATVSDPHEIANVLGVAGVRYMLESASRSPFKFHFGASPCVPATGPLFETAGATLGVSEIEELLNDPKIYYLAEVMNYPGVLNGDPDLLKKIALAKERNKPVDGHAPGLRGEAAQRYAAAGITTDHECFTAEEARDKIACGMKILIREGSAAKNFNALIGLLDEFPEQILFCSDDKHPNDLVASHIDDHVRRALALGINPFKVLRASSFNTVKHYRLPVGLLQKGDPADFIVASDLKEFSILDTYINGQHVASKHETLLPFVPSPIVNNFSTTPIKVEELRIKAHTPRIRVIEVIPGQLVSNEAHALARVEDDYLVSDAQRDILKLVVVNRYQKAKPAVAFVKNFGLKNGALASSVAHDSHNIVAVGVNDIDIAAAINALIAHKGGVSLAKGNHVETLALPIAGLMSDQNGFEIAKTYTQLDQKAKGLGSTLPSPFMTLSFLALLVIPKLKLSDKGLFDGEKFSFTSLFVE